MNSRLARGEAAFCLAANRWGHRSLVRAYFSTVSRLGVGDFSANQMNAGLYRHGLGRSRCAAAKRAAGSLSTDLATGCQAVT